MWIVRTYHYSQNNVTLIEQVKNRIKTNYIRNSIWLHRNQKSISTINHYRLLNHYRLHNPGTQIGSNSHKNELKKTIEKHTKLLQLMHLRFSGSLRRLRIILSFFSSSFTRFAISHSNPNQNPKFTGTSTKIHQSNTKMIN